MQAQQAMQPKQQEASPRPVFVEAEKLFEQMKEFSQSVAHRAYEFFDARGRQIGHELEDWFRAEAELMRKIPIEIKQTEEQITVRAEAPGFSAGEIKISVEPRYLVISGKSEKTMEEKKEQTVFSEFRSNQFCRELTLPVEIDPKSATAVLKDGVLELALAKAAANQPVNVEVKVA